MRGQSLPDIHPIVVNKQNIFFLKKDYKKRMIPKELRKSLLAALQEYAQWESSIFGKEAKRS